MSTFITHARRLHENGYSVIPLDGKRPLVKAWARFCKQMPSDAEMDEWERDYPDANIGLPAGPANGVVWLDCDAYTPTFVERVKELLPHSQSVRLGAKGFAMPVRFDGHRHESCKYKGREMMEILGVGQQMAAVGTHPDTGHPYKWQGISPLDVPRDEFVSVAINLPEGALHSLSETLNGEHFALVPGDLSKPLAGQRTVGVGGRNNALKAQVGAAVSKGKDLETIVREVVHFDKLMHSSPLFEEGEYEGDSPEDQARTFVQSITRTIVADRVANGVELPTPIAERATVNLEAVRESAQTGSEAMPNLHENAEGIAVPNFYNATQILRLTGIPLWYDEFYQRIRCTIDGVTREWTDADDLNLLHHIQNDAEIWKMGLSAVQQAVEWYAHNNPRNGSLEYFNSLKWDGCKRIEHFFTEMMGADDNEYVRGVSTNFWRGLAARVLNPGCKLDNMVVIEGGQGIGKSTALDIIGGEWYGVAHHEVGSTNFLQGLAGKLLTELAELDAMSKADTKTVKAMLSTRVDSYRPPYGRRVKDFKRQGIFVGTTNEDEYLEDPTGGRRFWPVQARAIDLPGIAQHRDQLFAEAVSDVRKGLPYWVAPEGAAAVQDERRRHDSWEDKITIWLNAPTQRGSEYYRPHHIAEGALGFRPDAFNKAQQMRMAAALKVLGYDRTVKTIDGKSARVWVKSDEVAN